MALQPKTLAGFHRQLHQWYAASGRTGLPWRNTADAYAIYVSEIMLQQTQVRTVQERFYAPFLSRFPTLASLARAKQEDVLKAWQGLGYYNRALNLHKTAKACAKGLPRSVEALLELPGIGRNTAHAVAAFAYRQPVAVMEANVRRVLSRIFALAHPSEAELWEKAQLLLDPREPYDYNQAMMDLGSLLCTKRAPRCEACPARGICRGKANPESYPAAAKAKAVPVRLRRVVVLRNAFGEYYARPRTTRFLCGLYHFVEAGAGAAEITCNRKPFLVEKGDKLGSVRQQYSHFTLDAELWLVEAGQLRGRHWHSPAMLLKLPVSMAERKIIRMIGLTEGECA